MRCFSIPVTGDLRLLATAGALEHTIGIMGTPAMAACCRAAVSRECNPFAHSIRLGGAWPPRECPHWWRSMFGAASGLFQGSTGHPHYAGPEPTKIYFIDAGNACGMGIPMEECIESTCRAGSAVIAKPKPGADYTPARILGLIDRAHPATAKLLDDAVVRDGLFDHRVAQW